MTRAEQVFDKLAAKSDKHIPMSDSALEAHRINRYNQRQGVPRGGVALNKPKQVGKKSATETLDDYGDMNNDNKVDVRDIVKARKKLNRSPQEVNQQNLKEKFGLDVNLKGQLKEGSLSKSEQLIEKNAGKLMDKWKAKAEAKARKRHEAGKHVFNKKYRNQFAQEDQVGTSEEPKAKVPSNAESTISNVTSDASGVGDYEGESVEVETPKVETPAISYEGETLERGHRLSQSNVPPSNPATNPRVTRETFKNPTAGLSEAFKNPYSRLAPTGLNDPKSPFKKLTKDYNDSFKNPNPGYATPQELAKKYKESFKKESALITQKSFIRSLINEVAGE